MTTWIIILRILQALAVVGVLTVANSYLRAARFFNRSLYEWGRGSLIGALVGTILIGIPFFVASHHAEDPKRKMLLLQFGVTLGTLLPLWIDPPGRLRTAIRDPKFYSLTWKVTLVLVFFATLGVLLYLSL